MSAIQIELPEIQSLLTRLQRADSTYHSNLGTKGPILAKVFANPRQKALLVRLNVEESERLIEGAPGELGKR